jgi:hypothetical protein
VATSTAPASIAEFFRTLTKLEPLITEGVARLIRKFAKAFGLLEDEGFNLEHLQVIIDDPEASKKVVEVLDLHRANPYLGWYRSLSEANRTRPHQVKIVDLDVVPLTRFILERNIARLTYVGQICDWYDDHFLDFEGLTYADVQEIKIKLRLLGFPTQID